VALDLGYASHSHVTDRFRRRFGVTPSDFRRESRGSQSREGYQARPAADPAAHSLTIWM
jgi:AraC-like DNA-binding protein